MTSEAEERVEECNDQFDGRSVTILGTHVPRVYQRRKFGSRCLLS